MGLIINILNTYLLVMNITCLANVLKDDAEAVIVEADLVSTGHVKIFNKSPIITVSTGITGNIFYNSIIYINQKLTRRSRISVKKTKITMWEFHSPETREQNTTGWINLFLNITKKESSVRSEQPKQLKANSRQLILKGPAIPVYNPFIVPQVWNSINTNTQHLAATGSCTTSNGVLGTCTSFRQCYPYFKLPELHNFDSWILGMYDTCSYYTSQGRQMFGVCCTHPAKPMEPSDSLTTEGTPENVHNETDLVHQKFAKNPYYPQIPNWPPPLPTHPPDHTIPPLPTHPPSPGFPTQTSPVWPPNRPITTKPPKKPVTSKPPYKPPTTTKPLATLPASGSCGAKNGYQDQERIVGGHNADVNEWPWIAALFNGGRQFCGGSLIDSLHILSAAHCVAHMSSWDVARLTVRLGDHNIKTNTEIRHIEKKVKRIVRHRGFDSRTLYNDIAILTLDSPIEFSQQIRPVCLPNGSGDYSGKTGTVIGWGSLRESGPQPAILQEVNIPIWNNGDCKLKYGAAAPGGIVEHMLCAGQANRDSCSGDSGGPLMINSGKWTQIGIVSWGIGCGKGQYPGVYTKVEKFLPWIYKNLK